MVSTVSCNRSSIVRGNLGEGAVREGARSTIRIVRTSWRSGFDDIQVDRVGSSHRPQPRFKDRALQRQPRGEDDTGDETESGPRSRPSQGTPIGTKGVVVPASVTSRGVLTDPHEPSQGARPRADGPRAFGHVAAADGAKLEIRGRAQIRGRLDRPKGRSRAFVEARPSSTRVVVVACAKGPKPSPGSKRTCARAMPATTSARTWCVLLVAAVSPRSGVRVVAFEPGFATYAQLCAQRSS